VQNKHKYNETVEDLLPLKDRIPFLTSEPAVGEKISTKKLYVALKFHQNQEQNLHQNLHSPLRCLPLLGHLNVWTTGTTQVVLWYQN